MLEKFLHEQLEIAFNFGIPKPDNAGESCAKPESHV